MLGCGDDPAAPPEDVAWHKHAANPVLAPGPAGSWDSYGVASPFVLRLDDGSFLMAYTGRDSTTSRIGLAASQDGIHWSKHAGNPVLGAGAPGAWDGEGVESPCLVRDGSAFAMYYAGRARGRRSVGRATSPDGSVWDRSGSDPVLVASPAVAWDDQEVFAPHVARIGTDLVMWYTGAGQFYEIGYATSADGVLWTKLLRPVIAAQVLEAVSFEPCVVGTPPSLRIWYGARHESPGGGAFPGVIDYAQSSDGVQWTAHRSVLSRGAADAWDALAVTAPSVFDANGTAFLWYEGSREAGTVSAIGLATLP